jgi:hypothetical protein
MVSIALRKSGLGQICVFAASFVLVSVSAARAQQPAAESTEQRLQISQSQVSERRAEDSPSVPPLTTTQRFQLATERAVASYFYPVLGAVTAFQGPPQEQPVGQPVFGYQSRFATAVADHTAGVFMTLAVMPSVFHQDPRYFADGPDRSVGHRAAYAASRVLVTRSESGSRQFNYSRIAGQAGAVSLSTLYNPSADRSVSGQLTSLGTRLMWDAAWNEMREFWPDIRQIIVRH